MNAELSSERVEQLIAELWVLSARRKVVKMDRDEVLSLIREVKRHRTGQNPWDRQRAHELEAMRAKGITP